MSERETISRGLSAGSSARSIPANLGRATVPSNAVAR